MSWFGGSISSITGQLSNLTKDILTEGTEEISDPATELRLAKEKIEELQSFLTTQRLENERLKKINRDIEEKAESSELQINAISREYRSVLETKEKEVNSLKKQHAELLEQQAQSAAHSLHNDDDSHSSISSPHSQKFKAVSSGFVDNTDSFPSLNYDGSDATDWDFDDSIQLQRENNQLRSNLQKAAAEAKHWRTVAGQLGQKPESHEDSASNSADVLELQLKIKELETSLAKKGEQLQQQATSLHEHHRHKTATLKEGHAKDIQTLHDQVAALEHQLSDASSGPQHSGTLPESDRPNVGTSLAELERKLASALSERDKAQNARVHLEGVLEELQQEVERLQDLNERQEHTAHSSDEAESLQAQIVELGQRLTESQEEKERLESRLRSQQTDAVRNKHSLLDQLDANHKNEASISLLAAKEERDGVMASMEGIVSGLGDEDCQKKTAELLSVLEKENTTLKEQNTKLEEQVLLLEKTSSNQMEERRSMLETLASLQSGGTSASAANQGEALSESDDTVNTRISSDTNSDYSQSVFDVKDEEVEAEVMRLRSKLERMMEESSEFEMDRSDWLMEKEALDDIVTDLRKKSQDQEDEIQSLKSSETARSQSEKSESRTQGLESEMSSLKEENNELEKALEELDTQHSQALSQLIGQRDKMAAQIAEQETELEQCRTSIESLESTIGDMKSSGDDGKVIVLEEKCEKYEQELFEWKEKCKNVESMEGKIKDLKEKFEKGGLVINDLHMDKQDLESQLATAKEEMEAKVAKLKEGRLEKAELQKEKKALEERLTEAEERLMESEAEVEKWQQLNEDRQLQLTVEDDNGQGKQEAEMECSRLRTRLESMEMEKEVIKEEFQCLIDGGSSSVKGHSDRIASMADSAFQHIFEEELKVRQRLEEDEGAVHELKEYVEKLRGERQSLKEKVAALTKEKNDSDAAALVSIEREKAQCVEQVERTEVELQNKELEVAEVKSELERIRGEKFSLQESFTNMQREKQNLADLFDSREQELKLGKETGDKSLQSLKEMSSEMDTLREQVKEMDGLRHLVGEKKREVDKLTADCGSYQNEIKSVKSEISRLEGLCGEKEEELESVKERMEQFDRDLGEMEESVNVSRQQHETEMKGKEEEIGEMVATRKDLELRLNRLKDEMETVLSNQTRGVEEGKTKDKQLARLQEEIKELKQDREAREDSGASDISQLEAELSISQEKIESLREELSQAKEMIESYIDRDSASSNMNKNSIAEDRMVQQESRQQMSSCQPQTSHPSNDATCDDIEFMERGVANQLLTSPSPGGSEDTDEADDQHERFELLEKEMEELRGKLSEKDGVISELQRSNASLLEVLEKKANSGDNNLGNRLATHKLEMELKSLRAEREQMMAVVSEKSRENSALKSEIHRLMDTVAAGQNALSKVREDNRSLEQQQHQQQQNSPPASRDKEDDDDMKREALNTMARLVRDKDTEIEALTQKNTTLLAVLQDQGSESQAAAHLGPLLQEKEALGQRMAAMMAEREQLIACVTQKHSESLAFHGEIQRLTVVLTETQEVADTAKSEYAALIPAFEVKTQALVSTQQELVECKQKLAEIEVRHGELIQRSNSIQQQSSSAAVIDANALGELEAELEKYKRLESDYKAMVVERDGQIHSLSQRMKALEETVTSKETECAHLKKQVDNSKFQLTGLMAEIADAKSEKELVQQKSESQGEQSTSLRNSLNQLRLSVQDKDVEISSLREQLATLNSVLQSQQGEQNQVALLMREHEAVVATSRQLQQERDYNAMLAEQRMQECGTATMELSAHKDKVFKLGRELERLRSHLIEIEEGYTNEALEAEEREKELRNKLAVAEEQLVSSTSHVQLASQESHRHVESLQEQLHHVASQRDAAYMQVATTQDQCEQYAASLRNLQLVLEHFQKEKESAVSMETEKYQDKANKLTTNVKALEKELQATRGDLTEALDGLEAASRLSEQLDRKQDALAALKEEVQMREQALKAAEEEIAKLNSSKEAKVDKMLMHNMVLTWLTSPEKKRLEIVQLIGHVLDFSNDDFNKIESAHKQDSLWIGFFRRPKAEETPTKADQSFSQLFVKFLEKESTAPPTPVQLPVEAMAAEAQARHKTNFNPFTAPRHVTHGREASGLSASTSGSSSHLLMMPQDTPHPSPLFAPVTSVSSAGESAILKDVLDWKR